MALLLCMYIYSIINLFVAPGSRLAPERMLRTVLPDGDRSACHAVFRCVQFKSDLHQLTSILQICPPEKDVTALGLCLRHAYKEGHMHANSANNGSYLYSCYVFCDQIMSAQLK